MPLDILTIGEALVEIMRAGVDPPSSLAWQPAWNKL